MAQAVNRLDHDRGIRLAARARTGRGRAGRGVRRLVGLHRCPCPVLYDRRPGGAPRALVAPVARPRTEPAAQQLCPAVSHRHGGQQRDAVPGGRRASRPGISPATQISGHAGAGDPRDCASLGFDRLVWNFLSKPARIAGRCVPARLRRRDGVDRGRGRGRNTWRDAVPASV